MGPGRANRKIFVHKHPATASSWAEESIREILAEESVYVAEAHMCMFNHVVNGKNGEREAQIIVKNAPLEDA